MMDGLARDLNLSNMILVAENVTCQQIKQASRIYWDWVTTRTISNSVNERKQKHIYTRVCTATDFR